MTPTVRPLADSRILVTGGSGFLGQHILVRARAPGLPLGLRAVTCRLRPDPRSGGPGGPPRIRGGDSHPPGRGGRRNRRQPGGARAVLLREPAYGHDAHGTGAPRRRRKFVGIGTICSYPKYTPVPFSEEQLWNGYPEETNAAVRHGQEDAARPGPGLPPAVRVQCDSPAAGQPVRPRRQFRPGVVPRDSGARAQVPRGQRSSAREIVCWGDGTATREFLYVEDCAEAIVLATERYDGADPVNIGAGFEISIRDLTTLSPSSASSAGASRGIASKPNGQPRRCLDTSRAAALFGFRATTELRDGLARTIAWYQARESSYNLVTPRPHSMSSQPPPSDVHS